MAVLSGQSYLSKDGDVIDQIVFEYYGDTQGNKVEKVLAANPGLASIGAVIPAGQEIILPDLETEPDSKTAQLWG